MKNKASFSLSWRTPTLVLCLTLWSPWGCSPDLEERQGALGEVCFSDGDCRAPLFCDGGVCVREAARREPAADMGEEESGEEGDCVRLCAFFMSCFPGDIDASCAQECAQSLESFPADIFSQVTACYLGQRCEDLERGNARCAPDPDLAPIARRNLCEIMSAETLSSCASDEVVSNFYELCLLRAVYDDDEAFRGLDGCFSRSSCEGLTLCLESWVGVSSLAPTGQGFP